VTNHPRPASSDRQRAAHRRHLEPGRPRPRGPDPPRRHRGLGYAPPRT